MTQYVATSRHFRRSSLRSQCIRSTFRRLKEGPQGGFRRHGVPIRRVVQLRQLSQGEVMGLPDIVLCVSANVYRQQVVM